ncbi:GDSL-type esterase/lipase family protein [Chlorogloeopsis fritschii PCC 9212]|jgi:lysophospholipase L1-like esterase|uniref:Arylesterase n=1 Tax=Chlorogloeopsis fritschii PCC 6912 TaxID=211165 RepID=A0A433MXI2_CHLFR|nr:GDSL-type esterase/lipase family protein [Chlorogloeopsis fritschii]MBF2004075.1 G-D-S-L family lipolytic protein [Chlorogloeopsis fritschii C42_A2020_084]RUR72865.1 arylesterase [Chlorogloeopsis fritschii PCC 6912]
MNTLAVPQQTRLGLKVIALGDSLIYGFGDPIGGGWIEQLRRRWMSAEHSSHALYNLGIRGNGVAQVQARLEQEFRRRGELRNRFPDLIVLSVGVNDSARLGRSDGRSVTEFMQFQAQLANLLDQARQLCNVVFVGMVPVDESKMPFMNCFYYNHADQYHYKEATKLACAARQIPYLDVFDLWLARGTNWVRSHLCSDGLHPNFQGYQALLQDVINWEPIAQLG